MTIIFNQPKYKVAKIISAAFFLLYATFRTALQLATHQHTSFWHYFGTIIAVIAWALVLTSILFFLALGITALINKIRKRQAT